MRQKKMGFPIQKELKQYNTFAVFALNGRKSLKPFNHEYYYSHCNIYCFAADICKTLLGHIFYGKTVEVHRHKMCTDFIEYCHQTIVTLYNVGHGLAQCSININAPRNRTKKKTQQKKNDLFSLKPAFDIAALQRICRTIL